MEELWRNMEHGAGGEYACCGVFQPRFTELLTRADVTLTIRTRKLTVKLIKEIGYGARGLLKRHAEIVLPERVRSFRQPLIKEYMTKTKGRHEPEDRTEQARSGEGKRINKSKQRTSRYANPGPKPSGDEEVVIKNPPSVRKIFADYVSVKGGGNGQPVYWEWKAG